MKRTLRFLYIILIL